MPPKERAAGAAGQISPDMAALLRQKIQEMERGYAEESERTQKAQKHRARDAAKVKLKQAKKLVEDPESLVEEKVSRLWQSLQQEHEGAENLTVQASNRMQELGRTEAEGLANKGELTSALEVRTNLESLCRQLAGQSETLVEEHKRLTEKERRHRHDLANGYQQTIEEVKKKMDQQADERARLAKENEDLRSNFKEFFETYDLREKELHNQQKAQETEVVALNAKLEECSQSYTQEASREAAAQREHDKLCQAEVSLREQLRDYVGKFNNFQSSLCKSDKVLSQYKRQKNKMQRRVELLEKENHELQSRRDKRVTAMTKEHDVLQGEKEALQEKCRRLQSERQILLG